MKSTNTFGVQFVARKTNGSEDVQIYVRITVNKRRAEISLKKTVNAAYWDNNAGRVKSDKKAMKELNPYIEEVRFKLTECYRHLQLAHKPLTAEGVKSLFLGQEEQEHTLCSLITFHNTNMKELLSPGTLKNYFTTEKYLKLFLEQKQRRKDIYLSELNYQFITEFEIFLRKGTPLDISNPLTNNGIMKHMERLKKMVTLAAKMEWISKDPFQRYSLRFQKVDKAFLTAEELLIVETTLLPIHKLNLARDLFVFSCYTGLSYIDLVNLKPSNICTGADSEEWIYTFRQKTDIPVRVPLLPRAKQ
ncbi:MAG: site-specific integrase, partial [Flavisolibacter sp.]